MVQILPVIWMQWDMCALNNHCTIAFALFSNLPPPFLPLLLHATQMQSNIAVHHEVNNFFKLNKRNLTNFCTETFQHWLVFCPKKKGRQAVVCHAISSTTIQRRTNANLCLTAVLVVMRTILIQSNNANLTVKQVSSIQPLLILALCADDCH